MNPAAEAFVRSLGTERAWAQVLIQASTHGFILRHIADREVEPDQLRNLPFADARKLSMFTESGQFRPLRSSPDLARGWVIRCQDTGELWRALQELYPGSLPDWFAAQSETPPITHYREFAGRQSGMYRITQLLTDDQAANVTRAACHPRFCLKRRLWTVPGLGVDRVTEKSSIPCLEPCALLLELARKAGRIEQEQKSDVQLSGSELESLLMAARTVIENGLAADRIGNIGSGTNPRRLQLLLEKFKQQGTPSETGEREE